MPFRVLQFVYSHSTDLLVYLLTDQEQPTTSDPRRYHYQFAIRRDSIPSLEALRFIISFPIVCPSILQNEAVRQGTIYSVFGYCSVTE